MAKKSICAKFFCPKNGFFGSKKFYRPKQPAKREDNIIETMFDDAPKAQGTTRQKIFFEIFFAPMQQKIGGTRAWSKISKWAGVRNSWSHQESFGEVNVPDTFCRTGQKVHPRSKLHFDRFFQVSRHALGVGWHLNQKSPFFHRGVCPRKLWPDITFPKGILMTRRIEGGRLLWSLQWDPIGTTIGKANAKR